MTEPWDTLPTFAVVFEQRVIGTLNFEIDVTRHTAMIGYAIGRAWRGRGFATEATRAAMAWAIEAFGLVRVWASTEQGHVRAFPPELVGAAVEATSFERFDLPIRARAPSHFPRR